MFTIKKVQSFLMQGIRCIASDFQMRKEQDDSCFVSLIGKSEGLCLPQVNEATAEYQMRKERESCIHGTNWPRKELKLCIMYFSQWKA